MCTLGSRNETSIFEIGSLRQMGSLLDDNRRLVLARAQQLVAELAVCSVPVPPVEESEDADEADGNADTNTYIEPDGS